MKKSCPYCGKIVPTDHVCEKKPKYRRWAGEKGRVARFHHSTEWTEKSREIRRRDGGIDQAAAHGLDGEPYVTTANLSVHHIVSLAEDFDRRLDNYNLITLSARTHELAEKGLISRDELLKIARENEEAYLKRS